MNTRKIIILSLFLLTLSSISFSANKKPISLFNGKNLKGWETLVGDAEFKVEDGHIVGTTNLNSPSTYLVSKQKFTNFILEYDIKLEKGINSGVQIRSQYDYSGPKPKIFGLQVEADDSPRNWTAGIYDQSRNGWRYNTELSPDGKKAYKRGDWNHIKVIASGHRIATWMNGVNVANLYEENVETGFVALQIHTINNEKQLGETHWRNIEITEITEDYKFEATAPVISFLNNKLTAEESKEGWKLLWDGKTSNGWRGAKLDDFPEQGWKIENGMITIEPSGGGESVHYGDIVTTRSYTNFVLEVDFKISKGANSGIKYFVDTELNKEKGSAIGCEFQILDDELHPDAKLGVDGKRTIGSLYDIIRADAKEYVPTLGTHKYVNLNWNRARIIVNGNHVEHWLNGCKVVEYERNTQMWRAIVAYSKYAKWPNFGEANEGLILLQDHGDKVQFRNIKIKEL